MYKILCGSPRTCHKSHKRWLITLIRNVFLQNLRWLGRKTWYHSLGILASTISPSCRLDSNFCPFYRIMDNLAFHFFTHLSRESIKGEGGHSLWESLGVKERLPTLDLGNQHHLSPCHLDWSVGRPSHPFVSMGSPGNRNICLLFQEPYCKLSLALVSIIFFLNLFLLAHPPLWIIIEYFNHELLIWRFQDYVNIPEW